MNPRLASILGGAVLAAGFVAVAIVEPADIVKYEAIAAESPELAPLIKETCPDCDVQIDCWQLASGDLCRFGRRYGEGVGGVNADGSPATCTPDPANDKPWPCTGPSADWPERVKELREGGDFDAMIQVIDAGAKQVEPVLEDEVKP